MHGRPDGLWTTLVVNERREALGVCYSNAESLAKAIETGEGVYWSRKRGLWHKGATSGDTQTLHAISYDCDRDLLQFTVAQHGKVRLQAHACYSLLWSNIDKQTSMRTAQRTHTRART